MRRNLANPTLNTPPPPKKAKATTKNKEIYNKKKQIKIK